MNVGIFVLLVESGGKNQGGGPRKSNQRTSTMKIEGKEEDLDCSK
jgi:hypothetical protein